jgi:Zn-dependent peptidase ImmA (M78 family)
MKTFAEIEEIIREQQSSAPVKVVPIARKLGLNVYRDRTMNSNVSGMIIRDPVRGGSSGYSIYVNQKHPRNRRRFTIAHEIGHFVLHRDLIGDGIVDDALYRSSLSDVIEAQANKFASQLLMPEFLLERAIDVGIRDPAELSKTFEVSELAMKYRLGVPA